MRLVTVELTPIATAAFGDLDPNLVVDLLWLAASQEDQLEHISARAGPGVMHAGLFHLAPTEKAAIQAAYRICHRALNSSPQLDGWQFIACHADTADRLLPTDERTRSIPWP